MLKHKKDLCFSHIRVFDLNISKKEKQYVNFIGNIYSSSNPKLYTSWASRIKTSDMKNKVHVSFSHKAF